MWFFEQLSSAFLPLLLQALVAKEAAKEEVREAVAALTCTHDSSHARIAELERAVTAAREEAREVCARFGGAKGGDGCTRVAWNL